MNWKRWLPNAITLLLAVLLVLAQHMWAAPLVARLTSATTASSKTTINYQGYLTDSSGNPVNDPLDMVFRLYNVESGGEALWAETQNVEVNDGLFSVLLGNVTPISTDILTDSTDLWLGIAIGTDEEMSPREKIASVPYAMSATEPDGGTAYWSLTGNDVTTPGTHFLGTTDGQALELRVNNARALRLEPDDTSPNFIGGYSDNSVTAGVVGATISGGGRDGYTNQVAGDYGTVGGGSDNEASNRYATVGGGGDNRAIGEYATVGGGVSNAASGIATVGGGSGNTASASFATVGGGDGNTASGDSATIGGGSGNTASDYSATVGGGAANIASQTYSTVGGGYGNEASGTFSTVGGGDDNTASGNQASVGGGWHNSAIGLRATVGGGRDNAASGSKSTVGGGRDNTASDDYATVGGGNQNQASEYAGTVGGGSNNIASGNYSTVPGGAHNTAAGAYSFAAGKKAKVDAVHAGVFLFADSQYSDFNSAAANEFAVRATGGVRFVSDIDGSGNPSAGVRLAPGAGSWSSLSDRNLKENFTPVDGEEVLARLAEIPITTWNYQAQNPTIRHMGPMAQAFYTAFGLGEDDKHISSLDAESVALAAIQELYQVSLEQATRIQALEAENITLGREVGNLKAELAAQQAQLDALEPRLAALETAVCDGTAPAHSP